MVVKAFFVWSTLIVMLILTDSGAMSDNGVIDACVRKENNAFSTHPEAYMKILRLNCSSGNIQLQDMEFRNSDNNCTLPFNHTEKATVLNLCSYKKSCDVQVEEWHGGDRCCVAYACIPSSDQRDMMDNGTVTKQDKINLIWNRPHTNSRPDFRSRFCIATSKSVITMTAVDVRLCHGGCTCSSTILTVNTEKLGCDCRGGVFQKDVVRPARLIFITVTQSENCVPELIWLRLSASGNISVYCGDRNQYTTSTSQTASPTAPVTDPSGSVIESTTNPASSPTWGSHCRDKVEHQDAAAFPVGGWVGVAIGGVVFITLVTIGTFFLIRRYRTNPSPKLADVVQNRMYAPHVSSDDCTRNYQEVTPYNDAYAEVEVEDRAIPVPRNLNPPPGAEAEAIEDYNRICFNGNGKRIALDPEYSVLDQRGIPDCDPNYSHVQMSEKSESETQTPPTDLYSHLSKDGDTSTARDFANSEIKDNAAADDDTYNHLNKNRASNDSPPPDDTYAHVARNKALQQIRNNANGGSNKPGSPSVVSEPESRSKQEHAHWSPNPKQEVSLKLTPGSEPAGQLRYQEEDNSGNHGYFVLEKVSY